MSHSLLSDRFGLQSRPSWPYSVNRGSSQAQGLLSWWTSEPVGSPLIYDLSGRGCHGSMLGGCPEIKGSPFGGAMYAFDGVDDRVAGINGRALGLTQGTLAAWIQLNFDASVANKFLLDTAGGSQLAMWYDAGQSWTLYYGDPRVSSPAQSFTAGTRQHVVMTYDTVVGSYWVYVNGIGYGPGAGAFTPSQFTEVFLVDFNAGGAATQAGLIDVRVYSRVLSLVEVWGLYDPQTRWDLYWRPERAWSVPLLEAAAPAEAGGYKPWYGRGMVMMGMGRR